jgi:hypothetical protein
MNIEIKTNFSKVIDQFKESIDKNYELCPPDKASIKITLNYSIEKSEQAGIKVYILTGSGKFQRSDGQEITLYLRPYNQNIIKHEEKIRKQKLENEINTGKIIKKQSENPN